MKENLFTRYFFISLAACAVIFATFLAIVDPKQTIEIFHPNQFTPYHDNFVLKKIESLESKAGDFDTMILGSSTSEVFLPADVNEVFSGKSFSGSTGGGQTPVRYAFYKAGFEKFKQLKRVVYVVDFFEFNHLNTPGDFLYNSRMQALTKEIDLDTSAFGFFKYHLSHQLIESAFVVMKKTKRNQETQINDDGTTAMSMVLSPIIVDNLQSGYLSDSDRARLLEQVNENFYTYSQFVLNNFSKLNPRVVNIFKTMNAHAKENNIEIYYVLAPYQYDFKNRLLKIKGVKEVYSEWANLFLDFAKESHIKLHNPLESDISNDARSNVWRDGIHFNRESAVKMLQSFKP